MPLRPFPYKISRPPQCCGAPMTGGASGWHCTVRNHATGSAR